MPLQAASYLIPQFQFNPSSTFWALVLQIKSVTEYAYSIHKGRVLHGMAIWANKQIHKNKTIKMVGSIFLEIYNYLKYGYLRMQVLYTDLEVECRKPFMLNGTFLAEH